MPGTILAILLAPFAAILLLIIGLFFQAAVCIAWVSFTTWRDRRLKRFDGC
jgi:hypothetical protein